MQIHELLINYKVANFGWACSYRIYISVCYMKLQKFRLHYICKEANYILVMK